MVQEQRPGHALVIIAAVSLASWLALYILFWYAPHYLSSCGPKELRCGFDILVPAYLFTLIGALFGLAGWVEATMSAARRREITSALSIGLLLLIALVNAFHVHFHPNGSLADAGSWALFGVVSAILLATSVAKNPTVRRGIAVGGLALTVALLIATNLVS